MKDCVWIWYNSNRLPLSVEVEVEMVVVGVALFIDVVFTSDSFISRKSLSKIAAIITNWELICYDRFYDHDSFRALNNIW